MTILCYILETPNVQQNPVKQTHRQCASPRNGTGFVEQVRLQR